MATCNKCGSTIQWSTRDGKWIPLNPDDQEIHWLVRCREVIQRNKPAKPKPPGFTRGTSLFVWKETNGQVPWDDSLGDFRFFTDHEKTQGLVCHQV